MKAQPLITFLLLMLLCKACFAVPVLKLDSQQLDTGPVPLNGPWSFDWQTLHTDFTRSSNDVLMLPGLWNEQGQYTPQGYGTFRLVVNVPEGEKYLLRVPDAPSAIKLWVNGELVFQRGQVAQTLADEKAKFGPKVITLPDAKQYQLLMQVSNFHHKEGGMWHSLKLAKQEHAAQLQDQAKLLDAMVFSLLLSICFYLMISAWGRRGFYISLYFASFILAVALRSVLVGERIAYDFFDDMSWLWQQRLEHLLLVAALPFFVLYFHGFFRIKQPIVTGFSIASVSVLAAVILFADATLFTYTGIALQILAVCFVLYSIGYLLLFIKQNKLHGKTFLVSLLVWSVFLVHDFLYTHLLIHSRPLAQFGLISFVLFHVYLLWFQRQQEKSLINYVKSSIDQKTHGLKTLFQLQDRHADYVNSHIKPALKTQGEQADEQTQGQIKQVLTDLEGFSKQVHEMKTLDYTQLYTLLKPYSNRFKYSFELNHFEGHVLAQQEWLQHCCLLLLRLAEMYGCHGQLSLEQKDQSLMIQVVLNKKAPARLFQAQELDLVRQILMHHQSQLITDHFSFRFELARFESDLLTAKEADGGKSILKGNEYAPPILLSLKELNSEQGKQLEAMLKDHYQLIFTDLSLENIKQYRPQWVIWQFDSKNEYQLDKLSRIRQQYQTLPILLLVPPYYKTQLSKFIRGGISDYLIEPILKEEVLLRLQKNTGQSPVVNADVDPPPAELPSDARQLGVLLMQACIQFWQKSTGKNKAQLADSSNLWRVYIDGSTAKTRTLDKYLSLQSLPKKPRWETVIATAHYVLDHGSLNDDDKNSLYDQLADFNKLLSEVV